MIKNIRNNFNTTFEITINKPYLTTQESIHVFSDSVLCHGTCQNGYLYANIDALRVS